MGNARFLSKKVSFVSSLALATAMLGLSTASLAGCSDAEKESTFEPTFADAQPETPPPGPLVPTDNGDGGKTPVGPTTCDPKIPDPFQPTWTPPTKQAACDDAELGEYYDACLTNLGDATTAEKCKTWRDAHASCTSCIEPTDKSGPMQWYLDRKIFTLNIAGCVGLVANDVTTDSCAAAYDRTLQCTRSSCEYCVGAGGSDATYAACKKSALSTGVCQSLESVRQTKCSGVTGTSGSAKTCFPATGDTEKDHYVRVEKIFCGK